MDEHDRMYAQQAEYDALERGQSGCPRHWRNPDNGRYGEMVPGRPYKRGVIDCRDYTHTIYIDGRPQRCAAPPAATRTARGRTSADAVQRARFLLLARLSQVRDT